MPLARLSDAAQYAREEPDQTDGDLAWRCAEDLSDVRGSVAHPLGEGTPRPGRPDTLPTNGHVGSVTLPRTSTAGVPTTRRPSFCEPSKASTVKQ